MPGGPSVASMGGKICRSHATRWRATLPRKKAVAVVVAWQVAGQFGQRHFVDAALELHHHIQRHPVVVPAPGIELRMAGGAQIEIASRAQPSATDTRSVSGPCSGLAHRAE